MSEIDVPVTWRDRVEEIAGRRRDAWMVGALVAVVAVGGILFSGRTAPAAVAPPARSAEGQAATILVHVAGGVRHPGLYEMPLGSRVADALEAAGGARRARLLDRVNLARVLVDGERIGLGLIAEPGPAATATGAPAPIDLNRADAAALESIPGIGPARAAAILALRSELGSFTSVDQLLEVDGIGAKTLDSMRPYVTVG